MNTLNYKHMAIIIGVFIIATVIGLWSWNTLSALFDGPQAQYKHVLAATFMVLVMKWTFTQHSIRRKLHSREHHDTSDH